jgi:hypothetical protein
MDTTSIVLIVVGSFLALGILIMLFSNPLSLMVLLVIAGIIVFLLYQMKIISVDKKPGELDINVMQQPSPAESSHTKAQPKTTHEGLPEVFYISDNLFTYSEAPAVCKAYDSELATYSQVEEAYMKGAEWCGYGWSKGGMALFPTQNHTWQALQSEPDVARRTACGRPGINGGYFEPKTKFGVNCYGVKPSQPKKRGPQDSPAFHKLVDRIKAQLGKLTVFGWDAKEWSEYSDAKKVETKSKDLIQDIETDFGKFAADVETAF